MLSKILGKQIKSFQLTETPLSEIEKPQKSIDLFEFFRRFYSLDSSSWTEITNADKMKHSFMLMQFLSIKEPEICMLVQNMLSPAIIDTLHKMFSKNHGGKSPGWMFTKANKVLKTEIDLKKYDKSIITKIIDKYQLDAKDFDAICMFHADIMEDILKAEQAAIDMKKLK